MERNLVVLVGTSHYDSSLNLADIDQARVNINALSNIFARGKIINVDSNNLYELLDRDIGYILHTLYSIRDKHIHKPFDTFIFYYCGHGIVRTDVESLCLPLTNSKKYDASYTGLILKNIAWLLKGIKSKNTLFFLDACYSEEALQGLLGDPESIDQQNMRFSNEAKILAIASSAKLVASKSVHPLRKNYTLFTGELISTLENLEDIKNHEVDVNEIFDGLRESILKLDGPAPKINSNATNFKLKKPSLPSGGLGKFSYDLLSNDYDPDFEKCLFETVSKSSKRIVMVGWGLAFIAAQKHNITSFIRDHAQKTPGLEVFIFMTHHDVESLKQRVKDEKEAQPTTGIYENWPIDFFNMLTAEFSESNNIHVCQLDYFVTSTILDFDDRVFYRPYGPPNKGGKDCPWMIYDKRFIPSPLSSYFDNCVAHALKTINIASN